MVETMVWGVRKKKMIQPYMSRAWRLVGVKQVGNKSLANVIDEEEELTFLPYVCTP